MWFVVGFMMIHICLAGFGVAEGVAAVWDGAHWCLPRLEFKTECCLSWCAVSFSAFCSFYGESLMFFMENDHGFYVVYHPVKLCISVLENPCDLWWIMPWKQSLSVCNLKTHVVCGWLCREASLSICNLKTCVVDCTLKQSLRLEFGILEASNNWIGHIVCPFF